MTIEQLIAARRAALVTLIEARNAASAELRTQHALAEPDEARVTELREEVRRNDQEIDAGQAAIANLEAERARDNVLDELARELTPTGARTPAGSVVPAARVGQEPRTYARENDPSGTQFLNDVLQQFHRNDLSATERLNRHMTEERVERGRETFERAATGTGAYTGLVVPQYLSDEFADFTRAGRPLADAMRQLPLPETGMTLNVGKATTGTSSAAQTEGSAVSETNFDDTLLTIPVRTGAGSQTITRQAIDRGVGVDAVTIADLFSAYGTDLDSQIINAATNGLKQSGVATAITYTDGAPSVGALYPKLLQAAGAGASALKNNRVGSMIAVGTTLRWYWLLSQLTANHPAFPIANLPVNAAGVDYASVYGDGFAGLLPSGVPYIQDDNVPTNLGVGTDQDEVYFINPGNSLLWEDPAAPMLIRAEQPSAKTLGVDLVVYGYFAFEFQRRQHAQKITGTGLVAPAF